MESAAVLRADGFEDPKREPVSAERRHEIHPPHPGKVPRRAERLLRDLPDGIRLRLVAITGYGQDADRERARQAGFEHHLVKPIDLSRLESIIERTLAAPRMPSSAE